MKFSLQQPDDAQAAAHDVTADGKKKARLQEEEGQTARRRRSDCKKKQVRLQEEACQNARTRRLDSKKKIGLPLATLLSHMGSSEAKGATLL